MLSLFTHLLPMECVFIIIILPLFFQPIILKKTHSEKKMKIPFRSSFVFTALHFVHTHVNTNTRCVQRNVYLI